MDDYISASEIGEYLYCQRAWWLRRQGVKTTQVDVLTEGTIQHEELTTQVQEVERGSQLGRKLLWVGVALLVLVLIVKLLR